MVDAEVPWYTSPPDATLHWDAEATEGFLYFKSPKTGRNHAIPVTKGVSLDRTGGRGPIWHIEPMMHNKIATVSPSIHAIGEFHSPNPVQFHITKVTRG